MVSYLVVHLSLGLFNVIYFNFIDKKLKQEVIDYIYVLYKDENPIENINISLILLSPIGFFAMILRILSK